MKASRFKWQVAHLFRGQVLQQAAQFLLLVLLAKFGGDLESGAYILAMATTAPVFLLLDLDLRTVRSTDHDSPELLQSYLGLRVWCLLVAVLISMSIGLFFFSGSLAVLAVVTIFRVGESLSKLAFGAFQKEKRSELIGKTLTYKGLLTATTVMILGWLSGGSAVIVGGAVATIAILFATLWDLPKAIKLNQPEAPAAAAFLTAALTDFSAHRRIFKRALPLGVDSWLSSLTLNMPKYYVNATMGLATLSVFGLLMQLAYSIQLLIGAVGHTGVAPLSELKQKGDRPAFWRLLGKMAGSSLLIGILAAVAGTLIIPTTFAWLVSPEYNRPWVVFTLLVASCLTGSQRILSKATQACGSFYSYLLFDVIIFMGSFIASILLIERMGLPGAALALVIAFGLGLLATLFHTRYLLWPNDADGNRTLETASKSSKPSIK